MVRCYVEIDPEDVLDELSDEDLLRELESRSKHGFARVVTRPDEDAECLRQCIEHHDWLGAIVYLDRLFPPYKTDPASIASKYDAWRKGRQALAGDKR